MDVESPALPIPPQGPLPTGTITGATSGGYVWWLRSGNGPLTTTPRMVSTLPRRRAAYPRNSTLLQLEGAASDAAAGVLFSLATHLLLSCRLSLALTIRMSSSVGTCSRLSSIGSYARPRPSFCSIARRAVGLTAIGVPCARAASYSGVYQCDPDALLAGRR